MIFPNFGKIPTSLVVVIIQMFMFVNAVPIFGEYAAQAKDTILLYMIVNLAFTVFSLGVRKGNNQVQMVAMRSRPAIDSAITLFVSFFLSMALFYVLPLPVTGSIFKSLSIVKPLSIAIPYMLLFAFVISYTEELVFRGVLPYYLKNILSSVLFAVFHWYAYSGGITAMLFAFSMGLLLEFISEKFGIDAAIGVHTSWNLALMGAI